MSNLNLKVDAATSTSRDRDGKDAIRTRTNPIINFQLGLIAALLCAYLVVELSSPIRESKYRPSQASIIPEPDALGEFEMIPNEPPKQKVVAKVTKKPTVEKPVTKEAPPEVVPDDEPVIDEPTSSEPTPEPKNDTPTESPGESDNKQPTSNAARPMVAVSEVPLYPGCSSRLDRNDRIDCLNKKMARYIQKRFDTGLAQGASGDQTINITVLFTIGVDGLPKDLQIKAPSKKLEAEARKLIEQLPQMVPGKLDGVPIDVRYVLPIKFQIR
ncbi:energy transducer TonB [Nonlabens ponticola]|uniref:TonB C-terminal domain-containing protein n=1 Tax=Nonlabens ponticola TaxID=2496866 RepID=A0A3S9MUQ0_9FLAO|nr:energy transducer TonB [Nonlabens ponticola]AZQ42901.1 hypothetical protein EJ995_01110 [Nonlabens ponticola]